MLLHVSDGAAPGGVYAAERRQIMEIRMFALELAELVVVVEVLAQTNAEDQREPVIVMARRVGEKPVDHAPNGSDPGAGGDKQRIADGVLQSEIPVGTMKPDFGAGAQVRQPVGEKAVGNAIEAEVERVVAAWGRRDGIGAGDLAAVVLGEHGDELSRLEIEVVRLLDLPREVLGGIRQIAA